MNLEALLDSIYDGILAVDENSTIVFANPASSRFGVPVKKALGRKLSEVEPRSRILDVLRTGKPVLDDTSHVDSVGIDVVANITPVLEEGRVVGAVAIYRDVSEVMALKGLVTRYYAELEELRTKLLDVQGLVFDSPKMLRLMDLVQRVARTDSTVLISGESGVGKDVVAKLIHRSSERRNGPFVAVNCGAIPENLLESELLGYERGAFTGASGKGKLGLLETAQKGTLLLDEIGELPKALQVKLLRIIEEHAFRRVGGVATVEADVRFLAATNRDLKAMVVRGEFREDLFYRLNVVRVDIPPLRERREDIAKLIPVLLQKYNLRYHAQKRLSAEVIRYLKSGYSWPGNLRELDNLMERLVVSSAADYIGLDDETLADHLGQDERGTRRVLVSEVMPLREARAALERELLEKALKQAGSARAAARLLETDHSTVIRKAKRYGLNGC